MTYRLLFICCALLLGAVGLLPTRSLAAQQTPQQTDESARCFEATGECIAGAIRDYWEQNGGLPVFGYPITPLRVETVDGWTGPTQWFERDRLEDHGAAGVLAGRLGAELLALQGRPWQTAFERVSPLQLPADCRYFSETGHSLCPPFRAFWEANGGVARLGLPITEPFIETIGDWTGVVQYFERRRLEFHTEQPGSPVLMGLLGYEVLRMMQGAPGAPGVPAPPAPPPDTGLPPCIDAFFGSTPDEQRLRAAYEQLAFRETFGCPTTYIPDVAAAVQQMERGQMVWIDLTNRREPIPFTMVNRFIYAIFPGPTYQRYYDTWVAGIDPMRYDVPAPRDGLYVPWGGFGKLWVNDSHVREALGWATEPAANEGPADVVIFDNVYNDLGNLGVLILFHDTNTVYAFGRLDMRDEVQLVSARQGSAQAPPRRRAISGGSTSST